MPPGGAHFQPPYRPPARPALPGPGCPAPPSGYGPPRGCPAPPNPGRPAAYGPAFGPPAGHGPAAGGPPVVIDVGRTNGRKVIIGASVAGVLGLLTFGAAVAGGVDGGVGIAVVVGVLGLALLSLPVATIVRRDKVFRPRLLVIEAAGLRWDDPKGAPWAVPWSELAAVSISKHTPAQVGPESISDKLVSAASDRIAGERAHVRLDIFPADPGFAGRHPEMAHLWERQGVRNGYRLPLGGNVDFIPTIAAAMGRFAPHVYRGVEATEGFMGLS